MIPRILTTALLAGLALGAAPWATAWAQAPASAYKVLPLKSQVQLKKLAVLSYPPTLNKAVLSYARSQYGQQVGRGECWDLAAQALLAADARPASGYNFGAIVTTPMAGDIVQFYNARFETPHSWFQMGSPHHTAIVEAVHGQTVTLLQQNVNGQRVVSRQTLDLSTKTQGSYTIFRPVMR